MAKRAETTKEEANRIADALETMAEVVRRHPPSRYEIDTNQHIVEVPHPIRIERMPAGLDTFRCTLTFPPGVRMPKPNATTPCVRAGCGHRFSDHRVGVMRVCGVRSASAVPALCSCPSFLADPVPDGADPRLEAIRGAIDTVPVEVICNPDDASRVRAALVGMGRPFELHQDPGIRDGRVIVVNKARLVHIPRPPEGEDPTLRMGHETEGSDQCTRCDHSMSDHNTPAKACTWRRGPKRVCRCPGFTDDATDWRASNDRDPERKVPTHEEMIKSGDLVELPDYWCGP
jgi:hypothetical protein